MTLNHLHIISNLIINQNFENFKLGKRTKLNLYDVKECLFRKIINEGHNIFFPSISCCHGTTQVRVNKFKNCLYSKKTFIQRKWGTIVFNIQTSIIELQS